jgi:hypothetical protein
VCSRCEKVNLLVRQGRGFGPRACDRLATERRRSRGASLIGERGRSLVLISYAQANGLFTEEPPRAIIHREFIVVCFPEASIVAGGSHDRARTHRGAEARRVDL